MNGSPVKPDEHKVKAITLMKGAGRLLGIVYYLAKSIPNLSTVAQPIRLVLVERCTKEIVIYSELMHANCIYVL